MEREEGTEARRHEGTKGEEGTEARRGTHNPQSSIVNRQSSIPNPQSSIRNSQSAIPNSSLRLAYAGITLAFLAITLYACSGPRGSDQFWYLGETITLMAGEPPLSNTIFPGPLLRGEFVVEKNYFNHHTLVSYLVLPFATWLGAYRGWIAFNIVSVLTAGALIAVGLRRLATHWVALIGYGVFLLLPVTIWQTANMLQEAAFCMITALLSVLYVFGERSQLRWIVLFAVSAAAVLCHPLYLPLAAILPVLFLWRQRSALTTGHFVLAGMALGVVVFLQTMKSGWFPSIFQPSFTAMVLSAIPGRGNMEWHYRVELPALTPGLMISKVVDALKCQLALRPAAVFFWPTNVMLLGSVLLIRRRGEHPKTARLVSATVAFIALFALLVCLHQNQFRFSLIITPAILMSTAVYTHRAFTSARGRQGAAGLLATVLLGFAAIDVALARHLRRDGTQAAMTIESIRRQTEGLGDDQRIVIEASSSSEPLMLAYALRPRQCLILKRGYLSPQMVQRLLASFAPRVLFCRPNSDLPEQAGAIRLEADWPGQYREFKAYEIRQAGTHGAGLGSVGLNDPKRG
ncbi:MAG: hypothetical protein V3W34_07060 [Phycisphaerae bacterium]